MFLELFEAEAHEIFRRPLQVCTFLFFTKLFLTVYNNLLSLG